jgi:hypothetical protein
MQRSFSGWHPVSDTCHKPYIGRWVLNGTGEGWNVRRPGVFGGPEYARPNVRWAKRRKGRGQLNITSMT